MGYEFTVTKSEERMNIRTLLLTTIALTILCLWAINPVKAEETPPVTPTPEASPEASPDSQVIIPNIFRINRDVPCTNIQIVQSILAQRGQKPIASGSALVEDEQFSVLVLALNDVTGEFSIVIVNEQYGIACNIYAGGDFRLIGQ